LYSVLPDGVWRLDEGASLAPETAALGWALAAYRFERYREPKPRQHVLALDDTAETARARRLAGAIYLARDLINTPAGDLGPAELADAVASAARRHGGRFSAVVGDDLLTQNFPAIHAVGRASTRAPRLAEIAWGPEDAPKLTLVGKGVCFDTGGLDLKNAPNMLLMKKDMGGAAVMLALAQAVMASNWHVRLRLLIPAVENSVSGNAYRPGDVVRTRRGLSVEVGNTDAEGRVILADALAEADRERPDLLLDAATLTGAARVALGPDLPALFTPSDRLAGDLETSAREVADPLWRMPLHDGYRSMIESDIADINNAGKTGLAGAITAALFLKSFVEQTSEWAHLDLFAWNDRARAGRPRGGEATALRALYRLLERRFAPA
jgi:leucyl aminopeptidase